MTYGVDGALVVADREVHTLCRIFGHLDVRKHLFDFILNTVCVYVADHNYALLVRTIPPLVIVAQCLVWKVVNNLHCAYRQAVAVAVSGIHDRQ